MILQLLLNCLCLLLTLKKKFVVWLILYFHSKKIYEERKAHNMLSLMLNSRFKSLCFVSSFVGCEQGIFTIEKYDWKSLQPMFLKCYHHLDHVVDCYVEFTKHRSYEENSLDIFEMTISTSELVTKLVNKELLNFRRSQVDPKEIKCPLQSW